MGGIPGGESRSGRTARRIACLIAAGLACLVACLYPPSIKRLDMTVFDHYLQGQIKPPPPDRKVAVVLASERSMFAIQEWPWPRGIHAALLDRLSSARVVAMDITMSDLSTPAEDAAYVAAVEKSGRVVQAMYHVPEGNGGEELVRPFPALAAKVAGAGITNIPDEPNGIYRDAYLYWRIAGELIPSFPAAVLNAIGNPPLRLARQGGHPAVALPAGTVRLNENLSYKVHHPHPEIPVYEYIDVYNGKYPPETFRDAVVLVGVNAVGATDHYPIGRARVLPATLYNAHALLTLMHGWIPGETPRWWLVAAAGLLAALGAGIGWERSLRRGWALAAAAAILWLGTAALVFFHGRMWLPPVLPLLGLLVAFFTASLIQLRAVSGEWRVSHLSIESLLALGGGEVDGPAEAAFPDYLASRWNLLESTSGIRLIAPYAGEDNPEVRFIRAEEAKKRGKKSGAAEPATLIASRGEHRLLLRLPETRSGESRFTVLGWKGGKSAETVQGVSALVLSAATHFKAREEGKARRKLFLDVIRLIMGAVDAKDPTTAGHSERVAELARGLARDIGLPQKEVDEVYFAGLLHDVGKIGIPDRILNYPERLSREDMTVMQQHPDIGAAIMGRIELPAAVRSGISEHHERLDGKGYPHHLQSGQLSMAGRIIKIADVYDALMSKRQYKESLPKETVYEALTQGSGKEFDADLLGVFLRRYFPDYPPGGGSGAGKVRNPTSFPRAQC